MWYLLVFIVVSTSIWVGIDASSNKIPSDINKPYSSNNGAASWVPLCLILWVVGFPSYLIVRSKVLAARKKSLNSQSEGEIESTIVNIKGIEPIDKLEQTQDKMKNCPFCGEEILSIAKLCKHCKSDLAAETKNNTSPKAFLEVPATETKVSPQFVLFMIIFAFIIFFGNYHIVTGSKINLDIIARESFGLSEIFINIDTITGMPWIAAKSKFPLSCRVLAREGFIETDKAFKQRTANEAKKRMDDIMKNIRR